MLSPHTLIYNIGSKLKGGSIFANKKGDKVPLTLPSASSSLSLVPTIITLTRILFPPQIPQLSCTCVAGFLFLKFRLYERRFVISLPTLTLLICFFYSSSLTAMKILKNRVNGKNIGRKRALLFIVIGTIYISIFDL